MYGSIQQKAAVCDKLCIEARLRARMWDIRPPGPTSTAEYVRDGKVGLVPNEYLMVMVAWDIWNGTGSVKIADLLANLNQHNLRVVSQCLRAIVNGPKAIDDWLNNRGEYRTDRETVTRGLGIPQWP